MEKRTWIHLASFGLALSVILGGSTIFYAYQQAQYKTYTEAQHQSSLSQLLNSLNQLETSLEKAQFLPEGAMRQTMAADIWMESKLASAALSALPLGDQRLEQAETYIAQVGDYAYYLLRNGVYGRADPAEWKQLCGLYDNASVMLQKIDHLKEQVDAGSIFIPINTVQTQPDGAIGTSLSQINDEFPQYASLIYDGPYSDHVSQRTPKALENLGIISLNEAQEKAAQLLQVSPEELTLDYESEGQIPAYGFSCDTRSVSISKQGGLVLSLTDSSGYGEASLSESQAIDKAAAWLRDLGLQNMAPSYYTAYENILTINFHYMENDIIIYPDLIKVGVALDDGSVVRLDTTGFAMNHHERVPVALTVDVAKARQSIPDRLTVEKENLVYIPSTGYNEVLCWEFVCTTDNGRHVLLYVNCENGETENILLLIESENGTLTR